MMFDRATRASHGRIIDRQSGWRDRRGGLAWWARFRLTGDVSSDNLSAVRPVLGQLIDGTVTATQAGLHVEGVMEGEDARDVNRRLLSALRRAGGGRDCGLSGPAEASPTGSLIMCPRARPPPRRPMVGSSILICRRETRVLARKRVTLRRDRRDTAVTAESTW